MRRKLPKVTVYTDGSCKDGKGGWAARLIYNDDNLHLYGNANDTTNNRMEMTAVLEAIKALILPCDIHLYSDSKYVLTGLAFMYSWKCRKWKTRDNRDVQNRDLWEEIMEAIDKGGHVIHRHWVKGHEGTVENEICDSLAKHFRLEITDKTP